MCAKMIEELFSRSWDKPLPKSAAPRAHQRPEPLDRFNYGSGRFIDPKAVIRYGTQPEPAEVSFDMRDAVFGHEGNLCTFETMLAAFGLTESRICQIHAQAIVSIKAHLQKYDLVPA